MENTKAVVKAEPIWKSFQKTAEEKAELKKHKKGMRRVPLKLIAIITQ